MDNQYKAIYELSLNTFLKGNHKKMAELADGVLANNNITISYLGGSISVNCETGIINPPLGNVVERFIVYQYLTEVCGIKNSDPKYISFRQLPQGEHHREPFEVEALRPLAKKFGSNLALFEERAIKLGGVSAKGGDMSFTFSYFPKISLQVIVYEADEEFPASANLLFDDKSHMHLTTATLYGIGINMAQLLMNDD